MLNHADGARLFMDVNELPEILEVKQLLSGARKEFRCRRLALTSHGAVLLFVSERVYEVAGLSLPIGTVTFGHFWAGRPYNVYHWLSPGGLTLAYYFNLADGTTVTSDRLTWRDLVLDVLVRPGERPEVLDEDELPSALAPDLRASIDVARAAVLADADAVTVELEACADALWVRAFGRPRA